MTDTPTPEPTPEEWRLARSLVERDAAEALKGAAALPVMDVALLLARHRVRLVGRCADACQSVADDYDAQGNAAQARGDWDVGAACGHAGAAALECAEMVVALSPDTPESLETLLERVRERWDGVTFRLRYYPQQSVGWKTERWLAEVGRVGNRHGFPRATGPTPHAALRALLGEGSEIHSRESALVGEAMRRLVSLDTLLDRAEAQGYAVDSLTMQRDRTWVVYARGPGDEPCMHVARSGEGAVRVLIGDGSEDDG